jgi:hypothetical protein
LSSPGGEPGLGLVPSLVSLFFDGPLSGAVSPLFEAISTTTQEPPPIGGASLIEAESGPGVERQARLQASYRPWRGSW